jgi:hypothetical protein
MNLPVLLMIRTRAIFLSHVIIRIWNLLCNAGRELRKQGLNDQQVFDEREKEVDAGTLQMPKQPAVLYVYAAGDKDFNRATGEVMNGYLRYVIYVPYATSASTGLPERPSGSGKGMPWLMNAGTYRAHIMINP